MDPGGQNTTKKATLSYMANVSKAKKEANSR